MQISRLSPIVPSSWARAQNERNHTLGVTILIPRARADIIRRPYRHTTHIQAHTSPGHRSCKSLNLLSERERKRGRDGDRERGGGREGGRDGEREREMYDIKRARGPRDRLCVSRIYSTPYAHVYVHVRALLTAHQHSLTYTHVSMPTGQAECITLVCV